MQKMQDDQAKRREEAEAEYKADVAEKDRIFARSAARRSRRSSSESE
jgi:hypothetical protein